MSAAPRAETTPDDPRPLDESTVALEQNAAEWIRTHPWTSVLGATALGLLVARLMRRER